jgi:lipopolysaccharide/colanic/teichoic acid biosynthesis glycosyltransferase
LPSAGEHPEKGISGRARPSPGGKRLFDIVAALVLLPVALPIVGAAVIAVRLESSGPALFVQDRLGRDQKVFRCLKVRTMRQGTREDASHLVGAESITRVGRFLRATKVDELPQLWNVLKGDMSFVGPRPGLPVQADLTAARSEQGVFDVLPGITGLAQVQGIDMSDPERLARIDREYIETRSMRLDLWLLLCTFTGRGQGDAARQTG